MRTRFFTFFIAIIISYSTAHATIRYVKPTAAGLGNGSSWTNASNNITAMITASVAGDQVWIAAGTYLPNTIGMPSNLAIYGGFAGTETSLSQRNFVTNQTIISGNNAASTLLVLDSTIQNAEVDGLTFSNATWYAVTGYQTNSFQIRNCIFSNNYGGTQFIYCRGAVSNCVFTHNFNNSPGAGSAIDIKGNYFGAPGSDFLTFTNCVIEGNFGSNSYAVRSIYTTNLTFINTVITNNFAAYWAALDGNVTFINSILYGNPHGNYNPGTLTVTTEINSDIVFNGSQNGYNPLFVNPASAIGADSLWFTDDDGLHVLVNSPCLNAGVLQWNGFTTPTADIMGDLRSATTPAIGAYEVYNPYMYRRVYVNGGIAASGSGGTWATAKRKIDEVYDLMKLYGHIDSIWIAAGTYVPDTTLSLRNKSVVVGGFAGNETQIGQRNYIANPTIFSGGNIRRVFNNNNLDSTAIVDGITIANGFADPDGGGVYNTGSSPIFNNCKFTNNQCNGRGGAVYNLGTNTQISKPIFNNCVFSGNRAKNNLSVLGNGGAMVNSSADTKISNCVFSENIADNNTGAIVCNNPLGLSSANVSISNCVFSHNTAAVNAGAIIVNGCNMSVVNSVFAGNQATTGGALYISAPASLYTQPISNSVFYGNSASTGQDIYYNGTTVSNINYSNFTGGYAGTGNINADPLFVNAALPAGADGIWMTADDGLVLQPCSPSINTGTTTSPALPVDILGNYRVGSYDMGAYEYQGNVSGLAPASGSQSATVTQTQAGTQAYSVCQNSHLIATVVSNGASPIAGSTTAKVWVEATQPADFVKRHYEITPAANASNATGRVTLYFMQAEFTAFNTQIPAPALLLPAGPADVTGKANLRIEKRGGTSSNGSGLPGTYSGATTMIDPVDADIVWNATASRWEVSFDVTGFSGFFVKTQAVVLPLRWLNISGRVNSQKQAQVNWQVEETAVRGHEVEKSKDAISFNGISYMQSKGDGNNSYQFTEPMVLDGIAYYRIKQTDRDGKFSYSPIIKLSSSEANKMQVYPSPFSTGFTVITAKPQTIILTDINGRILKTITVSAGSNYIAAENLSAGIYFIKTGDGKVIRAEKL